MITISYSFYLLILLFFIYSVIGYISEVFSVYRVKHTLVFSRGYLIGPYLPIFGIGAILMVYFLEPYKNDFFALFVQSLAVCCLLEYFTSLLMEKIFKLRWWDYSNRRFNINGRVCLENGVMFGIGGIIIVRYVNPLIVRFLSSLPYFFVVVFGSIIGFIMVIDFIISTYTISQLKIDLSFFTEKDATVRIKKEIMDSLVKYQFFHNRLFKAFPNIMKNRYVFELQKITERDFKKDNQ